MLKRQKGFTLIELLVVIAIIGLLATLAVVALNNARSKSRDAKRVSDIKQIQTALELYYLDQNGYPTESSQKLGVGTGACLGTLGFDTMGANCPSPYMGVVPENSAPNGQTYTYWGDSDSYSIIFELENQTGGLPDGVHTAKESGIQ